MIQDQSALLTQNQSAIDPSPEAPRRAAADPLLPADPHLVTVSLRRRYASANLEFLVWRGDRCKLPLYVKAGGVRPDAGGCVGLSPADAGRRARLRNSGRRTEKPARSRASRAAVSASARMALGCETSFHKSPHACRSQRHPTGCTIAPRRITLPLQYFVFGVPNSLSCGESVRDLP